MSLTRWVERPLRVAVALDAGEAGGTYYEAVMLVASVFSAIAAYVWPGEQIDRDRFVQAWVDFGGTDARRISVPLLVAALHRKAQDAEAEAVKAARQRMFGLGYHGRVLTGDEGDGTEEELLLVCPTLERRLLRRCSYPNVFYEHVRSKLVHEYQLEGTATQWPMTTRDAGVSYANHRISDAADVFDTGASKHASKGAPRRLLDQEADVLSGTPVPRRRAVRRIYFSLPWLVALARTMAANADAAYPNGKARRPDPWWSKA